MSTIRRRHIEGEWNTPALAWRFALILLTFLGLTGLSTCNFFNFTLRNNAPLLFLSRFVVIYLLVALMQACIARVLDGAWRWRWK